MKRNKYMKNLNFYGKEGNFYFYSRELEDEDYDVFFIETKKEYEKFGPIPYETSSHFCYVDSCITWAAYFIEFNRNFKWYICVIQDPDGELVKEYFDYDSLLEDLWRTFIDVPLNCETECIENNWCIFPKGTNREEIWHWFDERHSKGVGYLLSEIE